ncbi:MAG TPA: hypothetical protein VFB34_13710, partial [Chloroflexota bacterium]|nr:hypothetical protein [Chloroflexota bacterium]
MAFPNRYYDSVKLMRVSVELESLPGIHAASAVMATPMNVELLRAQGFEGQALDAGAETLVVAIAGAGDHDVERAFDRLDELLSSSVAIPGDTTAGPPRSLEAALRLHPQANLVVVAVPGQHAALEAWTALRAGRNVFLFSDNVSLSDEVKLKQAAASLGLVVMGPDCGTAMLGGIGLGFANRVRAGSIGLVGASGTGIQQVSSLIHQAGGGIAAAIGTGSRDLSTEVGGLMTLAGLEMLVADPAVERIGLISKPGDPD